jgi:hypothetical protein
MGILTSTFYQRYSTRDLCSVHTRSNEVSERSNRILMESAMSSLLDLNLPRDLWAVNTSAYI